MVNEKFRNRFRIPSARATWHNYNAGTYFVTICTQNREHCFGEIVTDGNGEPKMVLSGIGRYVEECIQKMETLHNDVIVPLWYVIPNHIHLIIINNTMMQNVEMPFHTNEWRDLGIRTMSSPKTYEILHNVAIVRLCVPESQRLTSVSVLPS